METKTVTARLDDDFGDVNVYGFEDKPSIQEKREILKKELMLPGDKKLLLSSPEAVHQNKFDLVDMIRALSFFFFFFFHQHIKRVLTVAY